MMNPSPKTSFRTIASAFVALFFVAFAVPQAAQAVAAGTVTIVASGGSPEGTNWTFASGEISPSISVSINASDVVAKLASGSVTILGDKVVINSSIVYANSNDLTFKVTGNILLDGGVTIQSQGGDVTFNADSDANLSGFVRFGLGATQAAGAVITNGGNITVGGGLDPLASSAVGFNADGQSSAAATACVGGTPPVAGIGIYGYAFNSGNGNISMRASVSAVGGRGFNMAGCSWQALTFTTTGNGSIYLNGDGSGSTTNPWGIAAGSMQMSTQNGNITLITKGSSTVANSRGMSIGGTSTFTSVTGNISFIDTTNGAAAGYNGLNIGGAITVSTGGTFLVQADEISHGGSLALTVASASLVPNTGTSFTGAYTVGTISAANTGSLTIGGAGNTSTITLSQPVTVGGTMSLTGGTIALNNTLTAGGEVVLTSAGAVTQTGTITSAGVTTLGGGTFTLPNQVVVIPPQPPVVAGLAGSGSGSGSTRTITGAQLDKVTAVKINGIEVKIVSATESALTFEVPTLGAGSHDVVMISPLATLTFGGAIQIAAPVAPKPVNVSSDLSSFAGSSTALSAAQKAQIRRAVGSSPAVLCLAYVPAKNATSAQRSLAKARAAASCAFAKSVLPKTSTSVLVIAGTKEEVAARTVTVVATR
jgi:hypothetical protein